MILEYNTMYNQSIHILFLLMTDTYDSLSGKTSLCKSQNHIIAVITDIHIRFLHISLTNIMDKIF